MYPKMYHHSRIPTILSGSGGSLFPPELQACEYLESSGNEYILLPYLCNDITDLSVEITAIDTNDNNLIGARIGTNFFCLITYNGKFYLRYFTPSTNSSVTGVNYNEKLLLIYNYINNNYTCNGIEYQNTREIYRNLNIQIALFAINYNGLIEKSSNKLKLFKTNLFELHACYIKSGQTYIDNKSITCQAGTPGMYDIVNGIFYTNDGTGNFTCGPDIII